MKNFNWKGILAILFIHILFWIIFIIDSGQGFEAITGGGDTYIPIIVFEASCTESWSCTDWSACIGNTQTRTCTDVNACGTNTSKPNVSQSCIPDSGGGGGGVGTEDDIVSEEETEEIVTKSARIIISQIIGFIVLTTILILGFQVLIGYLSRRKKGKKGKVKGVSFF